MKLVQVVLAGVIVLVAGCAVPPFEFNPETPNLNIALAQKRPLSIAVVVPEPMDYTIFYKGQGGYSRDGTAESREKGFPIERELSKIAGDTFTQIFTRVVVLKDLPQPGQYDAVVMLNIGQILLKEHVVLTGETIDMTVAWSMSVLDKQNREISAKKGISPSHNFSFSIFTPDRDVTVGMNEKMSLILTQLAREWGTMLYTLNIRGSNR